MKNIAVFTSGGDSPGMNAAIRAVVRTGLYHGLNVYGIYRGYNGMISGDMQLLKSKDVSNIIQKGGTILKSSRSKEFMTFEGRKKAYENLIKHNIEGIVAIGGDGTFTGAEIFYKEFGIPTIGIPGTIDNDLYGTDHTIGYDTAVNTALDAIDKIRDTADSHDRAFFIEVMGRDSGYIAIACGIGGGAEITLIPETKTSIPAIIKEVSKGKKSKRSFIFIVAEGDEEGNAFEIAAKVKKEVPYMEEKVTILGHIQRGGSPTALDRILASQMGMGAVEGLIKGEKNVMSGVIHNKICYTPLKETIEKSKPINPNLIQLSEILGASTK